MGCCYRYVGPNAWFLTVDGSPSINRGFTKVGLTLHFWYAQTLAGVQRVLLDHVLPVTISLPAFGHYICVSHM